MDDASLLKAMHPWGRSDAPQMPTESVTMVVKPKVNLCELIITVRPMMILPLISIFKIPYSVIVVTLFCMFISWRGIRARGNAWGVGCVDRNTLSQKRVVLAAFLDETWY